MFNLCVAPKNQEFIIERVSKNKAGGEKGLRHLNNLGFVEGARICVVSEMDGNLIVKIKDSKVAIGSDVAGGIYVSEEVV